MRQHGSPIRPLTLVSLLAVFFIGSSSPVRAETRVLRLQGKCDLIDTDFFNKALKLEVKGKATYKWTYYIDPDGYPFSRVGAAETEIHAQGDISNLTTTKKRLYYLEYIAFFDDQNKLIACGSGSVGDIGPGKNPTTCGFVGNSLIPSRLIPKISRYQFVLYESDQRVGIETLSGAKAKDPLGDIGLSPAVFKPVKPKVSTQDAETELYFNLPMTFEEYGSLDRKYLRPENRNNLYSIYFEGYRQKSIVIKNGVSEPSKMTTRISFDIERTKRDEKSGYRVHVAFLDSKGLLLACRTASWGNLSSGSMNIPHDMLLAVKRVQMVIYQGPYIKKKKRRRTTK